MPVVPTIRYMHMLPPNTSIYIIKYFIWTWMQCHNEHAVLQPALVTQQAHQSCTPCALARSIQTSASFASARAPPLPRSKCIERES